MSWRLWLMSAIIVSTLSTGPAWAVGSAECAERSDWLSSGGAAARHQIATESDPLELPVERQVVDRSRKDILRLLLPLLLGLSLLLTMVLVRAFRPKPMEHKGPSSTVDHWQEAGRRLK